LEVILNNVIKGIVGIAMLAAYIVVIDFTTWEPSQHEAVDAFSVSIETSMLSTCQSADEISDEITTRMGKYDRPQSEIDVAILREMIHQVPGESCTIRGI